MRETGNAFISKFSLTSLLHWDGDTHILLKRLKIEEKVRDQN